MEPLKIIKKLTELRAGCNTLFLFLIFYVQYKISIYLREG